MEEKEMTFWAHLEDLRWTLVRVVAVLFVFVVVCFCLMPYLFDNFVLAPTTSDFPLYRWLSKLGGGNPLLPDFSNDHFSVELININVASQFLTHISTSFWFALVLIFPYLTFEIWRFVQPALFDNEKKSVGMAFSIRDIHVLPRMCGRLLPGLPLHIPVPDRIPAEPADHEPDLADFLHG